jgi:catechol 2,3-dioxygenase-like lactoylglutathione lyase family enzyme
MRFAGMIVAAALAAAGTAVGTAGAAESVSATYLRTAIFVKDRAATVKFFRDVMGYEEGPTGPVEAPAEALGLPPDAKVTLTALKSKDGAGLSIMGVDSAALASLARPSGIANAGGDVMLVHQVTGIDEIHARAKAGGYEVLMPPRLSRTGKSKQMFLRDPNRVRLELYEMLPEKK